MLGSRSLLTAAVVFALVSSPEPATAAEIIQISYDVTGGTMLAWPGATPIVGGSLVYTPPGGAVSTPANFTTGGSVRLRLEGQSLASYYSISASVRMNPEMFPSAAVLTAVITPSLFGATGSAIWLLTDPSAGSFGRSCYVFSSLGHRTCRRLPRGRLYARFGGGSASGSLIVSGTPASPLARFTHQFTLGNEVRTLPEPSNHVNLAVGLISLAAYTLLARRRVRRTSQSA
jgi:hypothetical protein